MEIRFHPAARTEVTEAESWYRERSPLAAVGFSSEIARAVRLLSEAPDRYPPSAHGTRRFLLRRYPFSIFYRINSEVIEVVAVAHQKRRPDYWATRSDPTEFLKGPRKT